MIDVDTAPRLPFNVLVLSKIGDDDLDALRQSPHGPFSVTFGGGVDTPPTERRWGSFDAVIADAKGRWSSTRGGMETAFGSTAVLIAEEDETPEAMLAWLSRGAQDVLGPAALNGPELARRARFAIERKRIERVARHSYSTDARTGLPHREQFVEHMTHLLALRDREPAPMAVLVVRIEGLTSTGTLLGADVADVLRRRVAARLRGGVRASDVVASVGGECFALLLGTLLASSDAERVAAKVADSLRKSFSIGGHEVTVAAAIGITHYPQDGSEAERLLSRAHALAAAAPAESGSGDDEAADQSSFRNTAVGH